MKEVRFSPTHNQRLCYVLTLRLRSWLLLMVQEAGFEPANRYGLGPHPSAFDQAGRLLRQMAVNSPVFQNREEFECEVQSSKNKGIFVSPYVDPVCCSLNIGSLNPELFASAFSSRIRSSRFCKRQLPYVSGMVKNGMKDVLKSIYSGD